MKSALPKDDLELIRAFSFLQKNQNYPEHIRELARLISDNKLNQPNIKETLDRFGISNLDMIKEDILDLLIGYIHFILQDHHISQKEHFNLEILKRYFSIKEGDFFAFRRKELVEVIYTQLNRIYSDNQVNREEAIHSVYLQGLFDLSYDQFDALKETEVIKALMAGVDISKLDTARIPKSSSNESNKE